MSEEHCGKCDSIVTCHLCLLDTWKGAFEKLEAENKSLTEKLRSEVEDNKRLRLGLMTAIEVCDGSKDFSMGREIRVLFNGIKKYAKEALEQSGGEL